MKKTILIIAIILATACTTTVGRKIEQTKIAQLIPGKTTLEETKRILGKPFLVGKTSKGETMLVYHFLKSRAFAGVDSHMLTINFNNKGILKEFVNTNSGPSTADK